MEAVKVQIHIFLNSKPRTVKRTTANRMEAVEVQSHTFLFSAPDTVERSTAHPMEAVELQLHTFLTSSPERELGGQLLRYGGSKGIVPQILHLKHRHS